MRFHKTTAENKKPSGRRESCPAHEGGKTGQHMKKAGDSRSLLGFGGATRACLGAQADQRITEVICNVFLLAQFYSVDSRL